MSHFQDNKMDYQHTRKSLEIINHILIICITISCTFNCRNLRHKWKRFSAQVGRFPPRFPSPPQFSSAFPLCPVNLFA